MRILSLFDGISCGQLALKKANINIETYYSSEIDEFAMSITKYNFPNTIFLGDITKWKEWNIDFSQIDMVIGGSPCQGFSFAGKRLCFKDERSKLFFEYYNILKHIQEFNPNVLFLLENVKMDINSKNVISELLGVRPLRFNSNLLSAQNRDRLYWTNINNGNIKEPQDKGILLKDIIIEEMDNQYPLSKTHYEAFLKNYKSWKPSPLNGKSKPILATYYKQPPHCPYIVSKTSESGYRRLSPIESERLQTLPDDYTKYGINLKTNKEYIISNSQRYKTIGNGWTIDIICYIFKHIKVEKNNG